MTKTNTTEKRIETASKIMGKALARLAKDDPDMARRLGNLLSGEMQALRG